MIRAFLLALVGLLALAMVAHHLPGYLRPAAPVDAGPFARFEGVWEGTFTTYRPDGTVVEILRTRHEYRRVSDTEQSFVIADRHPDGRTAISTGRHTAAGDALECRVSNPDGTLRLLAGRRAGDALFWHRRDDYRGIEESYREQILTTPEGDLYTIDGAGTYAKDGHVMLLFEGRYRRADRADE